MHVATCRSLQYFPISTPSQEIQQKKTKQEQAKQRIRLPLTANLSTIRSTKQQIVPHDVGGLFTRHQGEDLTVLSKVLQISMFNMQAYTHAKNSSNNEEKVTKYTYGVRLILF